MSKINCVQKAFLSQYVALILIILSFMIGTSAARHEVKKPAQQAVLSAENHKVFGAPNYLNTKLRLENVFENNSDSINSENLESLKELLLNHNLDVHLTISANNRIAAKVVRLTNTLNEQGFWKNSFSVTGHSDPNVTTTKLTASFEWNKR